MEPLTHYFTAGTVGYKVLIGLIIILSYLVIKKVANRTIASLARAKGVNKARLTFVTRCFNTVYLFLFASIFAIATGIGYGDVSLFLSSVFAVLGVALFAQWSILSNITASFLIFFVFPYRIGDRIKVVDKDEDISGEIHDIRMFHVLIRHDNGNIIAYPNSLMLQKGVIKQVKKPSTKTTRRLYTRIPRK
ncbi:mechanosensitive ion channel family protein [Vibrio sp. V39_P1S14PM300]|uniref:mechanosensitive ion channel family protein n=1 Tax=Vibrio sp. V39_P1S14PM300 TaxID=1938690 RepID=UPI001372F86B|nr:mechanosensitive ion channel family protein [Vibrio sp. V39_P1S14PM300]NAX20303.1 mechanosensitive ion channel [Vibrio sp. V39_P1S14PM300]